MTVPERRCAPRFAMPPVGGPVSVVGARLLDVSAYGMRIETPLALAEDTRMPFRLVIGGEKHDVQARVANCIPIPGDRRAFGVGLEFVGLPEDVRERLRAVLQEHQRAVTGL